MLRDVFVAIPLLAGVASCNPLKLAPQPPFEIVVRVESDPGRPLGGAVIRQGDDDGPTTGADGRATVKIVGKEGESTDLTVRCPADYISSPKPLTVSLRRGSKLPELDWSCPPAMRHMVVAVRAERGPNLPVLWFGKVIGRTDANGAFTALFPLKPGEEVELTLDTSEKANRGLHPRSPTGSFIMKPQDDIVTFSQKFSSEPSRARPTGTHLPQHF
jgi:hypothetical protein